MNYKDDKNDFFEYNLNIIQEEKQEKINSLLEEEEDIFEKNEEENFLTQNFDNQQENLFIENIINRLQDLFDYFDLNQPRDTTQIINSSILILKKEPKAILSFMDPTNISLLVDLCEKRMSSRPNIYIFLKLLCEESLEAENECPNYIQIISESNISKYIKQNILKHSKKRTKYLALDLLLSLSKSPDYSTIPLWKKGVFDLFYDDISELNKFSELELLILLNASKGKDLPSMFSDFWINSLIPITEETENTNITDIIIQIFIEMSSNNVQFDKYVIDNNYMEYLASFINNDNAYLQVSVLRFLGILCSFGDEIIHEMLLYNVLTEVRNIFTDIQNKKEFPSYYLIECSALTFLRLWCEFSNENLNSLFSFVSQINFYDIFTESSYIAKLEMIKFIVALSSKANASVLFSILTEKLTLTIVDCLETSNNEYKINTQKMLENTIQLFSAPYPEISEFIQHIYDEIDFDT